MSTQENKMLVRHYFEEVLNQGKLEVVEELFAREYGSPEAGAALYDMLGLLEQLGAVSAHHG
jgi:hypothetical protein